MKKIYSFLIIGGLFLLGGNDLLAQFNGGAGTAGNPWQIATAAQLDAIDSDDAYLDDYFIQTAGIDLDVSPYNSGSGWNPIAGGGSGKLFTGQYNGNGKTISNLMINRQSTANVGLFGHLGTGTVGKPAVIKNVELINVNVQGARGTGSLVGRVTGNIYTLIENCSASGSPNSVSGDAATGGLVGSNNSYRETPGGTDNPIISKCWADIDVTYSGADPGEVNAEKFGGLSGCNQKGTILDSYALGDVTANKNDDWDVLNVGGLVGCILYRGRIERSFSAGAVSGTNATNLGGLLGNKGSGGNSGVAVDSYWNTTTSGQSSSAGGSGLTTAEMKVQANFEGFDFTNTWLIDGSGNNGYPYLRTVSPTGYVEWSGATSTAWDVATNWQNSDLPGEHDIAIIPEGLTNYPVITTIVTNLPKGISVVGDDTPEGNASITINAGGGLTISDLVLSTGASGIVIGSDETGTGSFIVEGTITADVTVERYLTHNRWHYISAPAEITGNFSTLSMGLESGAGKDQFYRWEESLDVDPYIGYWVDILNGDGSGTLMDDEGFVSCKGYAINYITDDETLSLAGVPYTADQSIAVSKTTNSTNEGANLVGNPFCSAIAINSTADASNNFLADNSALLDDNYQAIYVWNEQADYSYGARSDYEVICNVGFSGEGSGSLFGKDYVEAGQAFMVKVKQAGNIVFNKSIRKHGDAQFCKSGEEWPGMELKVSGADGLQNSSIIAFHENMTKGLDPSYDAAKLKGNLDIALYTRLINDNGNDFAVQALPMIRNESYTVAVGVDISENQVLTFSAYHENMDFTQIHLEDCALGIFTNLKENDYTAELTESGVGRFYLHFGDLTDIEEQQAENAVSVWAAKGMINIQSNHDLSNSHISITDLTGRVLGIYDGTESIAAPKTAGVYFVSLYIDDQRVTRKVLVH